MFALVIAIYFFVIFIARLVINVIPELLTIQAKEGRIWGRSRAGAVVWPPHLLDWSMWWEPSDTF